MSDTEENQNFCYFGKPLDPYDEDSFPKKKPISVSDQIATDAEGRRRFHGAFTGGFSAGFFNTVGSLEGWAPSEFKSTRQEKAKNVMQKPEDFMDDEDFSEYGIAHQTIKATQEYSTVKKRKKQIFSDGPIPGEPVLQTLLSSSNETVGYLLLKNIGIQEKIANQQEIISSREKVYGCHMPSNYQIPKSIENKQYRVPKIYELFLKNPKPNTFGLGYKSLDRSHINLFQSSSLVMKDKHNKKTSIKGQAFGVGVFEEEDEDIYIKEDMSSYDFELTKEKASSQVTAKINLLFGKFRQSKTPLIFKKLYPPPTIPHSFTGKHKVRKSRFESVAEDPIPVDRKYINPVVRATYLGENTDKVYTDSQPVKKEIKQTPDKSAPEKSFDISSILMSDRFVSASHKEDISNILEPVQKSETVHGTEDLREAARMKMFGRLTRVTSNWQPSSILCKRFNVPEPFIDRPEEKHNKKKKHLIFEYQKQEEEIGLTPGLTTQPKQEKNNSNEDQDIQEPREVNSKVGEQELETSPKDITEKVDVADKLDLFKTIFLSSSESEDEDHNEKEENTKTSTIEELKANVLSDSLIPKIKQNKEGILSNVAFHKFSKTSKAVQQTNKEGTEIQEEVMSYGPVLPIKNIKLTGITNVTTVLSDSEDEWIEKEEDSNKISKKKKKHKKEKHKKHKHDKKRSRRER